MTCPRSADPQSLGDKDRQRWSRYRFAEDRDRFATGVRLQEHALAQLAGSAVALTRACPGCGRDDHGPVSPAAPHDEQWSLSLSHSGDRVVVAVCPADAPVGIDVERVRPRSAEIVDDVLTAAEQQADAPFAAEGRRFTTRWVRKEAVLKATRQGLTVAPSDIEVTGLQSPARVLSWAARSRPAGVTPDGIQLTDVDVGEGYVCSVAVLTRTPVEVRLCRV